MTYNTEQLRKLNDTLSKMVSVNITTGEIDSGTKYVLTNIFNKLLLEARIEELEIAYEQLREIPKRLNTQTRIILSFINNRLNSLKNELYEITKH